MNERNRPRQGSAKTTSSDAPRWQVDRPELSEHADTVATLARAFHRDPLFDFLVPDAVSQARAALTFLGSIVADAVPFGEVWVARSGAAILGAAVWLPPGTYPRSARRNAVSVL